MAYHAAHERGGLGCGVACRPFERRFRAAAQERLLYEVDGALASMRAGEHAAARNHFQQVLHKADRLLGPTHVGLVPMLVGDAKALRATGRRHAAITGAKPIAGIPVAARRRRHDLMRLQPRPEPNGELLATCWSIR